MVTFGHHLVILNNTKTGILIIILINIPLATDIICTETCLTHTRFFLVNQNFNQLLNEFLADI